jgi:hypothetical protein
VWTELDEPERLARRLLDAQLLWVWLCTWWLLPRLPRDPAAGHRDAAERDGPIGADAARSPRVSSALAHYWRALGVEAERAERRATTALAGAVVAALRERFPDAPDALAVFPALRTAGTF